MEKARFYLDYAASTPMDPAVAAAVAASQAMRGNPSSVHAEGRALRVVVDGARAKVAALLGVSVGAVTFTSGATEANALAILGAWRAAAQVTVARNRSVHGSPNSADSTDGSARPMRVAVSAIEHESVRANVARLEAEGAMVDVIPAGRDGLVRSEDVIAAIKTETVLVSVMWANNVLGTVQPIAAIGAAVRAERQRRERAAVTLHPDHAALPIAFHCDAVQAITSQEVRPTEVGVDLLTISAHKMYGPKGIGALVCTGASSPFPLWGGGGQESGLRSGTENVPAIVGFGVAAELLAARRSEDNAHAMTFKKHLHQGLARVAPGIEIFGGNGGEKGNEDGGGIEANSRVLPGTTFLRHPSVSGDRLAMLLDVDGIAVSAGSACDAGTRKRPATLASVLGETKAVHGGVRVSFGRFTSNADIDALLGFIESKAAPLSAAGLRRSAGSR